MSRHALARAKERYGVSFSYSDLAAIVGIIKSGLAVFRGDGGEFRELYDVQYHGRKFRVVFGKVTQNIVTFLPPETVGAIVNHAPPQKKYRRIFRAGKYHRAPY